MPCVVCESADAMPAWLWVARDEYAGSLGRPAERSRWVMCRRCGLVFQNPRPDGREVATLYTGEVYRSELSNREVEERMEYFLRRPMHAIRWLYQQPDVTRRIASGSGLKVLDIGSGWGAALLRFRQRGWDVYGVEPDPRCAQYANERFGVPTRCEFLTTKTWPDAAFSLVFSQHAFEHMRDPLSVARVARQALERERGLLFICVPTYRRTWTLGWSYFNTAHTYMFTAKTLGNLLARAGFRVVASRYFSGFDREGEVWVLAEVAGAVTPPDPARLPFREAVWRSQAELAVVPLTAALGVARRLVSGVWLLLTDPRSFVESGPRMRLVLTDPRLFLTKARRRMGVLVGKLRLQFGDDRRA